MSVIINFFGGPGSGKSTGAAGLFSELKTRGYSVELVTEFAKELTYKADFETLSNQIYVFAEQDRRQRYLLGKAEYIITDSPIILGCAYDKGNTPCLEDLIINRFLSYNNINIFAKRDLSIPYQRLGRTQTLEESQELDKEIKDVLEKYNIPFFSVITKQVGFTDEIISYIEKLKLLDKFNK